MCFPSEHNLRKLTYVLLHATKAWGQQRWFQWRSRKLMKGRRELMKPSCLCTTALWAGIKWCKLHSRRAVQQKLESVDGGRRSSAQASGIEKSKETRRQAKCIEVWCWLGGKGFWSLLVLVWGGSPNAFAPGVKAAGGMETQPTPSPCCRLRLLLIILSRCMHSFNSC